ncbi:NUDIX hydrolase N-terminal domain-containing protein [Nocardia sp.]|uniref:NUDIX hydrolase N-terminal domain-containing protein n=1 Tax=unclassified Nocardia TaxID=2637762 RepID=UPI002628D870|nr:NUDIX hydrolase N-terminal domain-containing protein [Nocardia sp.]MCU1644028.1 family hydrolase [Nocardia sp.]
MSDDRVEAEQLHALALQLAAIAQNGITFVRDVFDAERYEQVRTVSAELMALIGTGDTAQFREILAAEIGYATPKVDVRAGIFDQQGRILLIQDRSDERWTPPGGWADLGDTPRQVAEKEVKEESGLLVHAHTLVACLDRDTQGHTPKLPSSVYKMFFLCDVIDATGEPSPVETMQIGYFPVDDLPPLSVTRILEHEIQMMFDHWKNPGKPTVFD